MDLSPAARLMLENQRAIMSALRCVLSEQWAGPHGGRDTEVAMSAIDAQRAETTQALAIRTRPAAYSIGATHDNAVPMPDRVRSDCPNLAECAKGARECSCAAMGQ